MRVVLDTNALVAGLLTVHGVCAQIVDRLLEKDFILCIDGRILAEYEEVLARPKFGIDASARADILDFIRYSAQRVSAPPLAAILPDPDDVAFLEVAAGADAVLVTGNTRHFPAKACGGGDVITPRAFLEQLRRSQ